MEKAMNARLIFACAVVGIAMAALSTPASAERSYSGTISFSSDEVRPGDGLSVFATCDDPDLATNTPVDSPILMVTGLFRTSYGTGWVARGWVKNDAILGRWPVSFKCGTETITGYLRVVRQVEPRATIGVQDREIYPGQEVVIIATCRDPEFVSAKVTSPVLVSPDLRRAPGASTDSVLSVKARVSREAKPGSHSLAFACAGKEVTGTFDVEGKPAPVRANAQVPVKPKGAAETGDGTA